MPRLEPRLLSPIRVSEFRGGPENLPSPQFRVPRMLLAGEPPLRTPGVVNDSVFPVPGSLAVQCGSVAEWVHNGDK